jgi:hypothetical protein
VLEQTDCLARGDLVLSPRTRPDQSSGRLASAVSAYEIEYLFDEAVI